MICFNRRIGCLIKLEWESDWGVPLIWLNWYNQNLTISDDTGGVSSSRPPTSYVPSEMERFVDWYILPISNGTIVLGWHDRFCYKMDESGLILNSNWPPGPNGLGKIVGQNVTWKRLLALHLITSLEWVIMVKIHSFIKNQILGIGVLFNLQFQFHLVLLQLLVKCLSD